MPCRKGVYLEFVESDEKQSSSNLEENGKDYWNPIAQVGAVLTFGARRL